MSSLAIWVLTGLYATSSGGAVGDKGYPDTELELYQQCLKLIGATQYEEARAIVGPVSEAHPDKSIPLFILGLTYFGEDKSSKALACFERAVALDSSVELATLYKGFCLYKLGETEQALVVLRSYILSHPKEYGALCILAMIASEDGNYGDASEYATRAIACAPTSSKKAKAYRIRAELYQSLGKWYMAKEDLLQAQAADPKDPKVAYRLFAVCNLMGDDEGANRALLSYRSLRAHD